MKPQRCTIILSGFILAGTILVTACSSGPSETREGHHAFNGTYSGKHLQRLAFPLGGMGAGMVCLEGNGCISHLSVRHKPDVYNEPFMFGAIAVKGFENGAKVLEGPVPGHKVFGNPHSGNGNSGSNYGYPRFERAEFEARFPFGTVKLDDDDIPVDVEIRGWSPFIPADEDNSSLPVAALEYTFTNRSGSQLEMVFSYHAENFMRIRGENVWGNTFLEEGHSIRKTPNGFLLSQECFPDKPQYKGDFAITTLEDATVDHRWFRGGWYDARTQLWKDIETLNIPADTATEGSTGASLYVPMHLESGASKTVHLLFSWHVPHSAIAHGIDPGQLIPPSCDPSTGCCSPDYTSQFYEPWYAGKFDGIEPVLSYWKVHYDQLKEETEQFSQTLFASGLPPEVMEAVSANLGILKSPTVLRHKNGKLWAYEGCFDSGSGCCHGSCTHVWNYAQAIPHLFPRLERTLRETEFLSARMPPATRISAQPFPSRQRPWLACSSRRPAGRDHQGVQGMEDLRGYGVAWINLAQR